MFLTVLMFAVMSSVCLATERKKKLINFGWGMKTSGQLINEIDQLQDMPFDGLVIHTNWCYTFYSKGLDDPYGDIQLARNIKWGKFTDNFMYMTGANNVDWFDDKLWAADGDILKNIRALAKIGAAAGCKGILFDPEFVYWGAGDNAWKHSDQKRHKEKSFDEFEIMVRKRGVQVINAIEEHLPDTTFLTLFWGSYFSDRNFRTETDDYGLLNAFMCGILEGADSGTRIVDGNKGSCHYITSQEYRNGCNRIKGNIPGANNNVLDVVPDELQAKYIRQVDCGHAVFADIISDAILMENRVSWALDASDHYVWFCTKRVNYLRHQRIEPGMIPAINRARDNVTADNFRKKNS